MAKKRNKAYTDEDIKKIFLFTFEEYLRFDQCFLDIINSHVKVPDSTYVFLQTKLLMIRKYEDNGDPVYLRNILDAIRNTCSELADSADNITQKLDDIENNRLEVFLNDGTKRNLHEAIEDMMYGLYLHADKDKIETIVKTDRSTYMFVVEKYVTIWESLLKETYVLVDGIVNEKYSPEDFKRASIVFTGEDNTQDQNIRSAPYWSNLRGRDAHPEERTIIQKELSLEEKNILALVDSFFTELKKPDFSERKLKKMINPVVKSYWGDFKAIHEEIAHMEIGFSTKIRFNDAHDVAYVLVFKNFSPEGLIIIDQPQYSSDIAAVYLKKENEKSGWKIVSLNIEPEKLIKTINIHPKAIINRFFGKNRRNN